MNTSLIAVGAFAVVGFASARSGLVGAAARASCEQMAAVKLENTLITSAEPVTRGTFVVPGSTDSVTRLPAFCRVAGEIRPTPDSHIAFELWLPLENWNGKFAGVGNGGWAGIISYPALADQLRRGYATVSTNTGHQAENGLDMAKFAFGHPERLADFGWRSVHEMTVKGKAMTREFYGRLPRYAYWIGCSTGGKQALTEAQRFPADYDGMVAMAPANNWTRLMSGTLASNMAATRDSASYLPPAIRRVLYGAALKACDARDGVVDSLIENPAKWRARSRTAPVSLRRRSRQCVASTRGSRIRAGAWCFRDSSRGASRSGDPSPTRGGRFRSRRHSIAGWCSAIRRGIGRR
jgi:feruloyl esterase